jgi:hypothetical protein
MFLYKREMHIVGVRLVEVLVVVLYSIKGFIMVLYDHLSVRLPRASYSCHRHEPWDIQLGA